MTINTHTTNRITFHTSDSPIIDGEYMYFPEGDMWFSISKNKEIKPSKELLKELAKILIQELL